MTRKFTGWHMTAILVSFFAVVMAVNFTMAYFASSTFGGVTVANSYVASQKFNQWLDAAGEQAALGWSAVATRQADGRVRVQLAGPGAGAVLAGTARHPLGRAPDTALAFTRQADGSFLSDAPLAAGRWTLRLQVDDAGRHWRQELAL